MFDILLCIGGFFMELLNVKELADLLKVTEQAIRNNIYRHKMPCYRLSAKGSYRFDPQEVLAWMRAQANAQAQGPCGLGQEALGSSMDATAQSPKEDAHGPDQEGQAQQPRSPKAPAQRLQEESRRLLAHPGNLPIHQRQASVCRTDPARPSDRGAGKARAGTADSEPQDASPRPRRPVHPARHDTDPWGLFAVLAEGKGS